MIDESIWRDSPGSILRKSSESETPWIHSLPLGFLLFLVIASKTRTIIRQKKSEDVLSFSVIHLFNPTITCEPSILPGLFFWSFRIDSRVRYIIVLHWVAKQKPSEGVWCLFMGRQDVSLFSGCKSHWTSGHNLVTIFEDRIGGHSHIRAMTSHCFSSFLTVTTSNQHTFDLAESINIRR
jgi:hypothetical protein